jgi:hypothetical protein
VIRLVVAAVLTVATVAAVAPAVEDARATRTDAAVGAVIDRLDRAGDRLAAGEDATATQTRAATRRVEVRVPRGSLTAARPAFLAVGGRPGGPGNRSVVAYALKSSPTRRRSLSVPIPVRTPDGPVVFRERGRHAVSIALVRGSGGPTLVVERAESP